MLLKLADLDVAKLSVQKNKDTSYIKLGIETPELQSDYIILPPFALPSKKYINEQDKSITLTIPISDTDSLYKLNQLDEYLESKHMVENKTYNKFIKRRDDKINVKFKLYTNTAVFVGKDAEPIHNVMDFYKYLKANVKVRFVLKFGKQYAMGENYGWPLTVSRLQISEDCKDKIHKVTFYDSDTDQSS